MDSETRLQASQSARIVNGVELNSWRRGFTPQAELWNGRMAMFGLAFGLSFLIVFHRLFV